MVTRRITYRLYPNRRQETQLHWARRMHCCLYNAAVTNRKTQYQRFNHSVDYFEQQNSLPEFKKVWTEYKKLGSQTLQATLKRVNFAFKRFFKGLGKYPKFKSSRHYSGWDYPNKQSWRVTTNNGVNGYLNLRDLNITVQMRGKARTWGIPKTCTIFWRNGKWYASITVECCPKRSTGKGAIGLDFGSKVAIATSNGDLIESPKFLEQSQDKITQLSKKLRRKRRPEKRKVKASRRWKKCQARISKVKRKVANQRQDWTHKVAAQIVSGNSLVVTEKLNIKGMTRKAKKGSKRKRQKTGLNRNLLDVAIGMLRESIKYKVVEAGGIFLEAPTQQLKPTQRCNNCWELTPKTLNDRVHICSHCGHTEDRDINAAQVCLTWGLRVWNEPL
ncbi:transposase [Limnoraphis robusta]|uniref:Transposase n=1 Tax=Limnoraphis robusta CCNP1315 TaxID=3110306 RepID=A0ABU5TVM5_9CYAN|nr:transposase [Limnoraphis robusta]MEA5518598.1 transposase [Limnoraphis robusta CCNP1315]MEA5548007.1 transposase [Limnoraphis robusta CCNP1324]